MEFNGKVITLSGSAKFENKIIEVVTELTKKGYCVLSFDVFRAQDWPKNISEIMKFKQLLSDIHFKKIDLCDELYVIDINGYVGESTSKEIQYAIEKGKPVRYYSQEHMENK